MGKTVKYINTADCKLIDNVHGLPDGPEADAYTRELVEGPDGEYGGMGLYREVHERHWKADLTPNKDTNA